MNKFLSTILFICVSLSVFAQQISISRIEQMPDIPSPYLMRNWKNVAINYDTFVFNTSNSGDYLPLMGINSNGINYTTQSTAAMVSYVGQTLTNGAEAINYMPAIIGASLLGIDKSNQDSQNWVLIAQDFFNKANGENIYLNNYSGSSGNDWWYETMPNIFFYQLNNLYPNTGDFDLQFTTIANQWLQALHNMGAATTPWQIPNMNYRAWNMLTMQPLNSGVIEPEAAGAIGWILYQAYCQTNNEKYRIGAEQAMEFLNSLTTNPSYELQLLYGTLNAAKMNAQLGTNYDINKLLNWCFNRGALRGWGCIVGKWGNYDCSGLIGEANDNGNDYAFIMNGFQQAACLAPLVRYNEEYANTIAKWILNLANASRLFYPENLPTEQQDAQTWSATYDINNCIAHEALKQTKNGNSPYATGDAINGGWAPTNLALYGSSHVGYLGAIVDTTNIEAILKLDLCATDFYASSYPTYLIWNPYNNDTTISINVGASPIDIYNSIENKYIVQNVSGNTSITIPAKNSVILVYIPNGTPTSTDGEKTLANNIVIDYNNGITISDIPPRIKALTALKDTVLISEKINVYCTAEDYTNNITSYDWKLNNENLSANDVLSIETPDSIGKYCISCIITSSSGQSDSASIEIEVCNRIEYKPEITEIVAQPGKIAPNATTTITCTANDQNNDKLTYTWSANHGTITENNNEIQWTAPSTQGEFIIYCTVSDNTGSTTDSITILVRDLSNLYDGSAILYFPFNQNTNDQSGCNHTTTSSAISYTDDFNNNYKSACSLNSSTSHILISNANDLNFTASFSVLGWIYPNHTSNDDGYIISHGSYDNRWKVSINNNKLRYTVKTNEGITDLDCNTTITNNTWYCFAMLYTGTDLEIYINGELDAFTNFSGNLSTTSYDMTIGKARPDQDYYYKGRIDELYVYDHAITTSAIENYYNRILSHYKTTSLKEIEIYPNPVSSYINIKPRTENSSTHSYKIIDIYGKILLQGNNSTQIDISTLNNGIYILKINIDTNIYSRKIIVAK